ncbi:MAG: hypothetical protein AAF682_13225 [Planctomycetota bacterium]
MKHAAPALLFALSLSPLPAAQDTLVKDINPPYGAASDHSYPQRFQALREKLIFAAIRNDVGQEIWASDGTEEGTLLLKDIHPTTSSQPHDLTLFRDRVLFLAFDDANAELWSTNGTELGTEHVADVGPDAQTSTGPMIAASDYAIFFVETPGDNEIWRTDGTAAGTQPVTTFGSLDFNIDLGVLQDEVYFTQQTGGGEGHNGLWKTDGTAGGTVHVKQPWEGIGGSPRDFTAAGDYLFFTATTSLGKELWRTDGTAEGTILLKDIDPGSSGSDPQDLVALDDGLLLFSASSASLSRSIWKSDGTPAGTELLFSPPPLSSNANSLVSFGDEAWFQVPWFFEDSELWRTDGTAAGTYEIAKSVSFTGDFHAVGSGQRIVWTGFVSGAGATGDEPFLSDGTTAGTVLVSDVYPGSDDSLPGGYTRAGNKVFFTANDGVHSIELHAFDLTDFGGWVAEPFGVGCGVASAPELKLSGELLTGAPVALELEGSAPLAPVVFYTSPVSAQDVIGPCNNYLAQPLLLATAATDAGGALSLHAAVPSDPGVVGAFLVVQSATVVAGGPFLGVAEFSNGLELVVGP